nr:hypothetical protein CFP56_20886 [Quercus suber]
MVPNRDGVRHPVSGSCCKGLPSIRSDGISEPKEIWDSSRALQCVLTDGICADGLDKSTSYGWVWPWVAMRFENLSDGHLGRVPRVTRSAIHKLLEAVYQAADERSPRTRSTRSSVTRLKSRDEPHILLAQICQSQRHLNGSSLGVIRMLSSGNNCPHVMMVLSGHGFVSDEPRWEDTSRDLLYEISSSQPKSPSVRSWHQGTYLQMRFRCRTMYIILGYCALARESKRMGGSLATRSHVPPTRSHVSTQLRPTPGWWTRSQGGKTYMIWTGLSSRARQAHQTAMQCESLETGGQS